MQKLLPLAYRIGIDGLVLALLDNSDPPTRFGGWARDPAQVAGSLLCGDAYQLVGRRKVPLASVSWLGNWLFRTAFCRICLKKTGLRFSRSRLRL